MAQDEDRLSAFEAEIAALKARTQRGLGERADAIAAACAKWKAGTDAAILGGRTGDEVRRIAHKLRGAAENETLRALAREIEELAAAGTLPSDATIQKLMDVAHARARASAPAPPQPVDPVKADRARLLVVDDDLAILKMLHMTLERLGGHEIVAASTGPEARTALDGPAFDVILLDAMMPTTNGLELCAEARARAHQREATLVVLSAATRGQLGWPEAGGPDHWWRKPLPPNALVAQVNELLLEV